MILIHFTNYLLFCTAFMLFIVALREYTLAYTPDIIYQSGQQRITERLFQLFETGSSHE